MALVHNRITSAQELSPRPVLQMLRIFGSLFLISTLALGPAQALVGPSQDAGDAAAHTVMLLKRAGNASGFCTGVVMARDIVLTAGHCVSGASDLAAYVGGGEPIPVSAASVHPGYRADAIKTRQRSIDLAMVKLSRPLPANLTPVRLSTRTSFAVGDLFYIAGFGLAREGDERSAGTLRAGTITARAPLSSILLWADDPAKQGFGACTGDSGGPIFSSNASELVAITVWSRGANGRQCGELTQGALIAPQRGWINSTLESLGR
ncbi:MAG: peptidase and chymotrypsin/Hap [Hyphomicrobiales bacterium]|nr:peptidase and chymotrypsin/Hap [Hyphomicrobiales bacterium]